MGHRARLGGVEARISLLDSAWAGAYTTHPMPRSLLRFGQVLMLLVLSVASGGHWMVLQSVAWTRMLVTYSQDGDFATAVTQTFDGRHPCALCQKIGQAKRGESRAARVMNVEQQAAFLPPVAAPVVRNDGISWRLEIPLWRGVARAEQPVAPPPRSAVA
jgi:hypothetical protein